MRRRDHTNLKRRNLFNVNHIPTDNHDRVLFNSDHAVRMGLT